MQRFWLRGLAGGVLSAVSYGIALWAMTLAPIAIVASLRETSVLVRRRHRGGLVLKEPLRAVAHRGGAADRRRAGADQVTVGAELGVFALEPREIVFGVDVPERGKLDRFQLERGDARARLGQHRWARPRSCRSNSAGCGSRMPIST